MKGGFDDALVRVFVSEGGISDLAGDAGGLTNLGITLQTLALYRGRPVARAELIALSRNEAAALYRARYWDAVRGDEMPSGLDYAVFDAAVNSGPRQAILWLQRALNVAADGVFGARTMAAIDGGDCPSIIIALCDGRLGFLHRLLQWPRFGRGWGARIGRVRMDALALATHAAGASRTHSENASS